MQNKYAEKLRKDWGDKYCNHPQIKKIHELGCHDGYVCCNCGKFYLNKQDYYRDKQKLNRN